MIEKFLMFFGILFITAIAIRLILIPEIRNLRKAKELNIYWRGHADGVSHPYLQTNKHHIQLMFLCPTSNIHLELLI